MEFNIDQLLQETRWDDETSRKAFRDQVKEHLSFCEKEMKAAFEKRDQVKKGYKVLEQKITELSTKGKDDLPRQKQLEAQIMELGKKYKCMNSSYLHKIIKDSFQWDEEKQAFISKDGKDIETTVSDFLHDDMNDFLVETEKLGGTGHSYNPYRKTQKPQISKDDEQKADELGLSPLDYLQIKQLREKKLKKVR
jgi:hypothetical protein